MTAVTKADLAATLSGTGPFMVFASTNAAFAALAALFNTAASVTAITDAAQIAALRNIILYHAVSGTQKAADLAAGASVQVTIRPTSPTGINDNTVYLSKGSAGVFLNGSTQVTTADVPASNGIIHIINKVLMPPVGTVGAAAADNPNLSVLVHLNRSAVAGLLAAGPAWVFNAG